MTKKEMQKNVDRIMMVCLEGAIKCADQGMKYCFEMGQNHCSGILLTASSLQLVNDIEFNNINNIISHMKGV